MDMILITEVRGNNNGGHVETILREGSFALLI